MGMGVPAPAGKVLAAIAQTALVLAASSAIAIGLTTSPSPLAAADGWIESVFFRFFSQARPPSDRIVIIGITEETIDQLPYRSPVDRGFLAKILEAMEAGQPEAIGLDLLFDQPTEPEKDQALRRVIVWRERTAFLAGGRPRPQELVATVLIQTLPAAPRYASAWRRHLSSTGSNRRHGANHHRP
jgi:CHASE2 domain-containing sensor protein